MPPTEQWPTEGHMARLRAQWAAAQAEATRLRPILDRYYLMLRNRGYLPDKRPDPGTEPEHLMWMIYTLTNPEPLDRMTPLKMNRWLGFIQGTMIARGWLTVPGERELTRGILTE